VVARAVCRARPIRVLNHTPSEKRDAWWSNGLPPVDGAECR
jgi:hypothetical protein